MFDTKTKNFIKINNEDLRLFTSALNITKFIICCSQSQAIVLTRIINSNYKEHILQYL